MNKSTPNVVYGVLPETLMRPLAKETRKIKSGTKDYFMKMINVLEEEFEISIICINHKEYVQRAISTVNDY